MTRLLAALAFCAIALSGQAQNPGPAGPVNGFEAEPGNGVPGGWFGGPAGTVFTDEQVFHGGKRSVRIERTAGSGSGSGFSNVGRMIPAVPGRTIELRGFIRTRDVTGYAGLWLRLDSDSGMLALDNMSKQGLKGTTGWAQYKVEMPLNPLATRIVFGFLVSGTGKGWADDLELLVDGKPLPDTGASAVLPAAEPVLPALSSDKAFDKGSGIALKELSKAQVENLATLGKVWGFLKYHHPRVTSGKLHWDYELLRALPAVLAAGDRAGGSAAISKWVDGLGPVEECKSCAKLEEKDIHLRPRLDWIRDGRRLGPDLAASLDRAHRNRPADGKQAFVSKAPGVGNPIFRNEPDYRSMALPDAGFQLLALFRFWNMVEYWFPYRDVIGEDWDGVLERFVPRIALAKTSDQYQLELIAFIATVNDTHANLWSSLKVQPPAGDCRIPVVVRFVESQAVVTGYSHSELGPATGLKPGDVIVELGGTPVKDLVARWRPYYPASNEPTRLRDMARGMTKASCGETAVKVRRGGETLDLKVQGALQSAVDARAGRTHDLPGGTFRLLSPEVAYIKISTLKKSEVPGFVKAAEGTKGLIVDIRNYPSDFPIFNLGGRLVAGPTEFVTFTMCDVANPGAFAWRERATSLNPMEPLYKGKIVILVDEVTQSSAEYHAMAFRAAPGAVVMGSTTAGADGNVSRIPLPGGLSSMFTGLGVFYPDRRPTQRVGIVPDIEVKPTIAGIRAGRDEVLERAVRQILGPEAPAAEIQRIAKPPATP